MFDANGSIADFSTNVLSAMNKGFCCSRCTVDLRNIVLQCRGMKPSKARLMCREPAYESEDEHAIHTHIDALMKKFFPRDPCHQTPQRRYIRNLHSRQLFSVLPTSSLHSTPCILNTVQSNHLKRLQQSKHARKPSDESAKSEVVRLSSDLIRPILKKSHMFDLHDGSTSSQSEAEQHNFGAR